MVSSKHISRVGYIEYKPADIRLEKKFDNTDNVFRATYGGTTYEHKDGAELERIVRDAIIDSFQIEWQPIIAVTTANRYKSNGTIGLESERLYLAQIPSKGLMSAQWSTPPEQRLLGSLSFFWDEVGYGAFHLPTSRVNHYTQNSTFYYAYTDELWQQVQDLQEYIEQTRTALLVLLSRPELIASAPHALFTIRKGSELPTQEQA